VKTNVLFISFILLSAVSFAGAATHTVKSGDNLYRIALNHGITLSQLQGANPGVNAQSLHVGQKLVIPERGAATAARNTEAAPIKKAVVESAPAPRATASGTYEIKAGDNLSKIAKQQGTTVAALQAANPQLNPNKMSIGQKINLSGSGQAGSSPTSAIAKAPNPVPKAEPSPAATPAPVKEVVAVEEIKAPVSQPMPETVPVVENKTTQTVKNEVVDPTPAPTSYRLIKTTRELTLAEVAKEHRTTAEKINALNGWSFSPQTLLAVDSELYVPAQP
jgi:LysM repeat protein